TRSNIRCFSVGPAGVVGRFVVSDGQHGNAASTPHGHTSSGWTCVGDWGNGRGRVVHRHRVGGNLRSRYGNLVLDGEHDEGAFPPYSDAPSEWESAHRGWAGNKYAFALLCRTL